MKRHARIDAYVVAAGVLALACAEPRPAPSAPPALTIAPAAAEREPEPEPEPITEVRHAEHPDAGPPPVTGPCADTLKRWSLSTGGATLVSMTVRTCSAPCRRTVRGEYFSRTAGTFPDRLSRLQRTANELDVEIVEWTPQTDDSFHLILECVES